uniref:Neurotransmitter-gated ion-channel transmembrane domain-containing protein n=1 Tax=Acrobeloides nanus TaxID=290746 RepID=A0A914EIR7_9BILA
MVGEMTPSTSESVPLIGVFFSCCMLVVSASVVFTVVVLNLHFRAADTHIMSPLLKKVLLEWMPWLFMMSRPGYRFSRGKCLVDKRDNFVRIVEKRLDQKIISSDPATDAQLILLHRLYTELDEITKRFLEEDEKERIETDWKFAAMVVDRACLIIFTLFITLFTCALMFSAPHIMA